MYVNKIVIFSVILIVTAFGLKYIGDYVKSQPKTANSVINSIQPESSTNPNNPSTEKQTIIATGLEVPWALAFLPDSPDERASRGGPDNSILVTERVGRVKLLKDNQTKTIATLSQVKQTGESGLHGIAIHPKFSENHFVYLYYTYSGNGDQTLNRVSRFTFENEQLVNEQTMVDKIPGAVFHDGGRIKFGPDGFLYISTGDALNPSSAQDKNSLAGKILRVTDEGKAAPGNPFNNLAYSYGHRNPQGLAWDKNGQLWATEHGPSGVWPDCCQDEVNKIDPGKNYGWPIIKGDSKKDGLENPVIHSGREIWAPAGAAFYKDSLFYGALRGTALMEYDINSKQLKTHFKGELGRIREVVLGPDNMLYITTSNRDGRGSPKEGDDKIIRIDPNQL